MGTTRCSRNEIVKLLTGRPTRMRNLGLPQRGTGCVPVASNAMPHRNRRYVSNL